MRISMSRDSRWPRRWATAAALSVAALSPAGTVAHAATASVNVTVNADEGLGTVSGTAYGANQAVWDSQMNTPASVNLLSQAGVGMMRYPGGSYGDIYHWQTNTAPGGYVAPGADFDSFMGTVKSSGAQAILIAGAATVFLLAFVGTWNALFLPLTMLHSENNRTRALGLFDWSGKRLQSGVDLTSLVLTGTLLSIIPLAALIVSMRSYWRSGVALGALK